MLLTQLGAESAAAAAVATLGLDPTAIDLSAREAIGASLRRAASFMCPTSPARLTDAVHAAVDPLTPGSVTRSDVAEVLEELITSGDLLELRPDNGRSTRLLYMAPPSFIERQPGHYLLMGIRPFGAHLIEDDLADLIEYEGPTRSLKLDATDGTPQLRQRGLREVVKDRWVVRPAIEEPGSLIDSYRVRIDVADQAGQLDGVQLLDPTCSVRYYAGRWRPATDSDGGDFVARRPQAYGADLWCLIRFEAGTPKRVLELPVNNPVVPGRDEAWRYQAAVDALRGYPQRFRRRTDASPGDDLIFDFFSPLPGFAERYLQLCGLALGKSSGSLFSFRVPSAAADEVTGFLTDMLWMAQEEAPSGV